MSFIHEDSEFEDLLQIVASERKLPRGLIEKDYWVIHSLWALHFAGFEVWFKGGTSLSKGFRLIERFSEDLDLKVEPGAVRALPLVTNWKSKGTKSTAERKTYFEKLPGLIPVPGANVLLDLNSIDPTWRGAELRVVYPGLYLADLGETMSPFVRLEVGNARVTPFVRCELLTSFVHEKLSALGELSNFDDNRPMGVRCVHPLVTLLEKLDALHRRFPMNTEPAKFVRHYEDSAHIIYAMASLPPLPHGDVRALAADLLSHRQIACLPTARDPAFSPSSDPRWASVRSAHAAIANMFWGPRVSLEDACTAVRDWTALHFD